ncbi:hypothetical protein [Runella sp. SP2]|uniref:hypothetical protein n=1 Tax=Runella sp. SP2 TaxID=2268026 RepID=UPI000F07D81A|nr:hypothetical protein [Runella sp. SP2]AYQ31399.1 hypothetical protein DTQ70_04040 [Runella sp. SP2]
MNIEAQNQLAAALAASREARQSAIALLMSEGETIELSDWVTIKEYAKRFNLESTNVVSNWIKRGIIPAENVREIPELNNIKLIKAVPYMEPA